MEKEERHSVEERETRKERGAVGVGAEEQRPSPSGWTASAPSATDSDVTTDSQIGLLVAGHESVGFVAGCCSAACTC